MSKAARLSSRKYCRNLGDIAQAAGTRILLEPLNRKEAWFLRQVADAAQIAKDVNHPAICVMGDFYHMYWEEPCDMAAFMAAGDRLHHVHLATGVEAHPSGTRSRTITGPDSAV